MGDRGFSTSCAEVRVLWIRRQQSNSARFRVESTATPRGKPREYGDLPRCSVAAQVQRKALILIPSLQGERFADKKATEKQELFGS